jgi:5-methylcytosine-specific restriction endonuclease McrA
VRTSQAHLKYCSRPCYYEGKRVTKEHFLERSRIKQRNRVARLHNASGDFSIKYFKWLCEKLENVCVMCDKVFPQGKLTIDHMVPITKGGKNDNKNIQPLCGSCNARKGNKLVYKDKRVIALQKQYA